MERIRPHISGGEHTRTLLFLLLALGAALLAASAIPTPQATAASGSYQWPIKPFDRPHPIGGSFGDPRTVFSAPPTLDGALTGGGKFAFHFGVDISAPNGTEVFPVLTGGVSRVSHTKGREYVEIDAGNGRVFQYWHIHPAVRPGQHAEAGSTVLGRILAPFEHVHLAEIRYGRAVNPLAAGHLTPYADRTTPHVASISVRRTETALALMPTSIDGRVLLVAEAYDRHQLPIRGAWHDMPVGPALVSWRLQSLAGRAVVQRRVAVDFRSTMPANASFWSYYARGTYQNMSVFGSHYSWGQPGCFLYKLTRSGFDTRSVRDGVYDLVVTVADTTGNASSRALRITIRNHPEQ